MAFDKAPAGGGGGDIWKAKEHVNAHALLVEIKSLAPQSMNNFKERKDAAYCDVTIFASAADLEPGAEPKVLRNARIDDLLLARELFKIHGEGATETVRVLSQWGDKKSWVFRRPPEEVRTAVEDWYEAREAAVESDPDMPDFL